MNHRYMAWYVNILCAGWIALTLVSPAAARALRTGFVDPVTQDGGTQFATGQIAVTTASGTLVRAANVNRRRLIVFNPGPNDVAIGTGTAIAFGNGYIIPAGSERIFHHQADVYAVSSSTNTKLVSWEEDQE